MSRLTWKIMATGTICSENGYQCLEKLYKLEDIEEELGIDLITLFKALKDGVYIYEPYDYTGIWIDPSVVKVEVMTFNDKYIYFNSQNIPSAEIKDYGKTWALTKEELENE